MTLIIIIVTPSIIFLSLRRPIQIAFAAIAWGSICREQYPSLFTHKYIFPQWHYQSPRELLFYAQLRNNLPRRTLPMQRTD